LVRDEGREQHLDVCACADDQHTYNEHAVEIEEGSLWWWLYFVNGYENDGGGNGDENNGGSGGGSSGGGGDDDDNDDDDNDDEIDDDDMAMMVYENDVNDENVHRHEHLHYHISIDNHIQLRITQSSTNTFKHTTMHTHPPTIFATKIAPFF